MISLQPESYQRICDSIQFYSRKGFQYIDTPWLVDEFAINLTLPKGMEATKCGDRYLVGSAEQGFLHLWRQNQLPSGGIYQSVSPCFRDDKKDELHSEYFIKNELFINNYHSGFHETELKRLIFDAETLLSQFLPIRTIEISENCFDIVDDVFGIELGSYGIRHAPELGCWIYGTGLAEPRLTAVLRKYGKF